MHAYLPNISRIRIEPAHCFAASAVDPPNEYTYLARLVLRPPEQRGVVLRPPEQRGWSSGRPPRISDALLIQHARLVLALRMPF